MSDRKMSTLRLSLGNVGWLALDYKGFGYDDKFKEIGIKQSSL